MEEFEKKVMAEVRSGAQLQGGVAVVHEIASDTGGLSEWYIQAVIDVEYD